jgi:hypothetical protein
MAFCHSREDFVFKLLPAVVFLISFAAMAKMNSIHDKTVHEVKMALWIDGIELPEKPLEQTKKIELPIELSSVLDHLEK